jgi:hypothetical protein
MFRAREADVLKACLKEGVMIGLSTCPTATLTPGLTIMASAWDQLLYGGAWMVPDRLHNLEGGSGCWAGACSEGSCQSSVKMGIIPCRVLEILEMENIVRRSEV